MVTVCGAYANARCFGISLSHLQPHNTLRRTAPFLARHNPSYNLNRFSKGSSKSERNERMEHRIDVVSRRFPRTQISSNCSISSVKCRGL
ncbi:hypothetical protein PHAVU_007G259050 [Phaseolus vulgaris]